MYVCLCSGTTEAQIIEESKRTKASKEEICKRLNVGPGCGGCLNRAFEVLSCANAKNCHHSRPKSS